VKPERVDVVGQRRAAGEQQHAERGEQEQAPAPSRPPRRRPVDHRTITWHVHACDVAGGSPRGIIGSERRRMPVALKIALPMAGATPTDGVSPAPADGRLRRSSSTTSTGGTSPKRGTRYDSNRPLTSRPSSNSTALNSAPPSPWTTAP